MYDQEYYCPHCGATLNDQPGFDPDNGTWTCTECGQMLMDDDIYNGNTFEGVAWFCDNCGALLNRQDGFTDSYGSWRCTECGYVNGTTEDDIIDGLKCPRCGALLETQSCFNKYDDDWECTECGAHLHHSYSDDEYEEIEEPKYRCPECGASLDSQCGFSEYDDDWECTECGARLHRDYSFEEYSIVEDDEDDTDADLMMRITKVMIQAIAIHLDQVIGNPQAKIPIGHIRLLQRQVLLILPLKPKRNQAAF